MNHRINWSEAAKYGLLLSIISVLIEQMGYLFSIPSILASILNLAKFAGSVAFLYYIMTRNASAVGYTDRGFNSRFGIAVCFFSALVCSAFTILTFTVFYPTSTAAMLDAAFEAYDTMGMAELDYDTVARVFPYSMSFAKFLSCFIIGLIASPIIATIITRKDNSPFSSDSSEDNLQDNGQ